MAEYVPVYTKRERRFRNLGKVLFIVTVIMIVALIMSIKVSIIDNDFQFSWVTIENNEGDDLSGLLLTPNDIPSGGAPAVIVVHDLGGHKEQNNRLSFELARQGYVVLALDLRDHGRSRGSTTFNDYYGGEPYDVIAAYDYLVQQVSGVDVNHIGVVGDGFGGASCLMAYDILLKSNISLDAVVAWGPPIDITMLYNNNWDEIEPFVERRISDVDWGDSLERANRSIADHMNSDNWSADAVFIIYGGQDEKVPVEQFALMRERAELFEVTDVGHDLSEEKRVLEYTIDFLYKRLEKTPMVENDFNYEEVETVNNIVHVSTFAVMLVSFMMVYEVLVMNKTSRSYISQLSKDIKPMFLGFAMVVDVVVYVGISLAVGKLYDIMSGDPLTDILPAARFYVTMIWAAALLLAFGMLVWWGWSYWMPRDEERTEETCGNLRGLGGGLLAFLIIVLNYLFGQVILYGPNYPKSYEIILVAAFCFGFFLGHELWMRKMLHMKVQALLGKLFLRHRWPYHLTFFAIMYGLYALLGLVMLWNLGRVHFDTDFQAVYILFVGVIGLGSTIIYHRSRSIMATVTFSTIMAPWLLNIAHHL